MSLTTTYWNICKLTEALLSHCEKHNIQCWIEFGSLIGLKRHNGVIPWDYDGDYGMWVQDKDKFISTFKSEITNIVCNVDYYRDVGCLALHFDGNEDDIVDVVFYVDVDYGIDSTMGRAIKDEYPANDDYCYKKEDFYPLRRDIFLGHTVYIPNKWESVLNIHYTEPKWDSYPSEYQKLPLKFLNSPTRTLARYYPKTFAELVNLVENAKEPLLLPKTAFLTCDTIDVVVEDQINPIYGYTSSITWEEEKLSAKDLITQYRERRLQFNVVDSPVDNKDIVLSTQWKNYALDKLRDQYKFALTWVATNAYKTTHFHTDPEYAGGYMKLFEGEKIWWLVAPEDFNYLLSKGYTVEKLAKYTLSEMLELEDCYLFGKIYVDILSSEDMIWFPINTLHKVFTTRDSFGFGGYL